MSPYFGEVGHHFLDQGSHGGDVDDLEAVQVDSAVCVHVPVQLPQNAEQSHVCLPCSLGGMKVRGEERRRFIELQVRLNND